MACFGALVLAFGPARAESHVLRLATTTSTVNSGLTDALLPAFETETGISVTVIAVGTGKALKMGRDGAADVVLVHAPEAERRFVDAGYGIERREVMYNDFVIVGPKADPAEIRGSGDVLAALRMIHDSESRFVSRGDDSGTHKMEMQLWNELQLEPYGLWYREVGLGMSDALRRAEGLNGYTLTDRGTWLFLRDRLTLDLLIEDPGHLTIPYGVIAINPERHPQVNARGAQAFMAWLTSRRAQELIRNYRVRGEPLFVPLFPENSGQ